MTEGEARSNQARVQEPAEGDELPSDEEKARDVYAVARLLALSDGVFAIAMTLLVLNVPVPDLPGTLSDGRVWDAFLEVLPNIANFALSFVLVGLYWMVHHRLYRTARSINQGILWLNLLALLLVCLVPFTTSFYSRYDSTVSATEVYYGNLLLTGAAFTLLSGYGHRSGLLPISKQRRATVAARSLAPIVVFGAAMLLAPVWLQGARYSWAALLPLNVLIGRVFRA